MQVLATEGYDSVTPKAGSAYIVGADGNVMDKTDTPIQGLANLGYTASPYIRHSIV